MRPVLRHRRYWRRLAPLLAALTAALVIACGGGEDSPPTPAAALTDIPADSLAPQSEPPPSGAGEADPPVADSAIAFLDPAFSLTEQPFVNRAVSDGWQTNFDRRTIRLDELARSVPRDTIPAIDNPTFTAVVDVSEQFDPREPVIVVEVNGDARAYPLDILLQHEIVNDKIGDEPVVVTYCPLCNSAIAFERTVGGKVREFGVSGFLRKSDLIMYDDLTETMWQQLTGEGVVGNDAGMVLEQVPVQTVSFETFEDSFPDGLVLDRPDFPDINYDESPYTGYDDASNERPFLFYEIPDRRIPVIERVAAADLGSGPVAYAFSFLKENPVVNDYIGEEPVAIFFDDRTESGFASTEAESGVNIVGSSTMFFRTVSDRALTFAAGPGETIVDNETGSTWDRFGLATEGELAGEQLLPVIHGDHFWFAWAAFKPDTRLVTSPGELVQR